MVRLLLSTALVASLSIPLGAGPAWACSCAAVTPEEHADSARVVFTGVAREVKRTETQLTVRFRVTRVYKGEVDRRVKVVTASNSAACGCSFKEDTQYTVFGTKRREPIPTNLCSGTKK